MEELKAHFKDNGEQVRLLTGRIDWQQKALQEASPANSSEALDSTGQAMSQILKAGKCRPPSFLSSNIVSRLSLVALDNWHVCTCTCVYACMCCQVLKF